MHAEMPFRLVFFAILAVTIGISAYYRKKAREEGTTIDRRAEGLLALTLRVVFTLPLLIAFLLYIFVPQWMTWAWWPLPLWLRGVGAGVGIVCIALSRWTLACIGRNISETVLTKPGHQLVTQGPYRWVRHPLYAVTLLEIIALGCLASNGFIILYGLMGALLFRFLVIPKEEENLIKAFGREYEDYRRRTGALLPRLWP